MDAEIKSDGVEFDADFDSGRGAFAVRIYGRLLPARFAKESEAFSHYDALSSEAAHPRRSRRS